MSKFCTNCGNQLIDEAAFCPKCGVMANTNNNVNNNSNKTNGFAIAGLILSFFTTILGLVFSIIGLVKSKTTNDGKPLAIVGLVISIFKILITIIFLLVAIPSINNSIKTAKEKSFENTIEIVEEYVEMQYDIYKIGYEKDSKFPLLASDDNTSKIILDSYALLTNNGLSKEDIVISEAYINKLDESICIKAYPSTNSSKFQNTKYNQYNQYLTDGCY